MHGRVFQRDHWNDGVFAFVAGRLLLGRAHREINLHEMQRGALASRMMDLCHGVVGRAFKRGHTGEPASEVARIPGTRVGRIADGALYEAVDIQGRERAMLVRAQVVTNANLMGVRERYGVVYSRCLIWHMSHLS